MGKRYFPRVCNEAAYLLIRGLMVRVHQGALYYVRTYDDEAALRRRSCTQVHFSLRPWGEFPLSVISGFLVPTNFYTGSAKSC